MEQSMISGIMKEALTTILSVSLPVIVAGLGVGIAVSIFQAATQINEQTLVFVPKIIAILLSIFLLGDWMLTELSEFTTALFSQINVLIK